MARTTDILRSKGRSSSHITPRPLAQPTSSTRVLRSHTAQAAAAHPITTRKPKKRRKGGDPWTQKRKPNPNPRPRAPPRDHFTCRICIEEQTTDQFVRWVPPKRARFRGSMDVPFACIAHLARNPSKRKIDPVCKTCISNAMSARLDTLGARKLFTGCLESGCEIPWSHNFVMRYMPDGAPLEKFNMEMLDVWKEDAEPKPVTCLSKTCDAIGLPDHTAAGYPQVACNECSFRSCAQCRVPWHKDLTCAEYAAKHVDEKMSNTEKDTLKLMQSKDGKRCPNCQLVIEKDGGCDSMFCVGCHKYFNWASAASAIAGAKKPEAPYIMNMPYYWHDAGPVTCEVDALGNTVAEQAQTVAAAS
ncbi:hypothetical protein BDW02DRAFT_573037 [Decorospora gaudefroyi]|uniref:RBR-type E3 ubiquitin transferase n=1 Tax=Decorospora gaudefroyi TaxID=184978 RepID=A0A6A5K6L7_9PLEO|nr:hypothetical protein BDW02DRAFT_573037 [Decorospora gaudefroyi]